MTNGRVQKPALLNRPDAIQKASTIPRYSKLLYLSPNVQISNKGLSDAKDLSRVERAGRSASNSFRASVTNPPALWQGDVVALGPAGEGETMVVLRSLQAKC